MGPPWSLLLVVLIGACPGEALPADDVVVDVVSALYHKLYSKCVFLLDRGQQADIGLEEYKLLLDARTKFSLKSIPVSTITFQAFKVSRRHILCDNRPIYVLLQEDSVSKDFLSEVSRSPHWGLTIYTGDMNNAKRVPSSPVWLVFLNNSDSLSFFSRVYIPFDCQFLVVSALDGDTYELTELYRVAKDMPLISNWFGYYHRGSGFNTTRVELYDRRNTLRGHTINANLKAHPPFNLVIKEGDNVTVGGFVGKVWQALERQMNFSTNFVRSVEESGSNDNLILSMISGEAEVGVSDATVRLDRLEFIDFSVPLMFTEYRVFIQHPGFKFLTWTSFLNPFRTELWLTLLGCMIILAIILSLFHNLVRKFGGDDLEEPHTYTFYNSMFYMWGVFCMQGHDITPRSSGCRVVYLVSYLTAITISAAYSAALISVLAVSSSDLPFTDIEGLMADGRYDFGTVQRSTGQFMMDISNDTTFKRLAMFSKKRSLWPTSLEEGFQRVCGTKFAFMAPMDYAVLLNRDTSCDMITLPGFALSAAIALILSKTSPYKGIINHNLNRMRKSGSLQKLLNDARPKNLPKVSNDLTRVDLGDVAPILVALLLGALIAVFIMGVERRVRHWINKAELRRHNQIKFIT